MTAAAKHEDAAANARAAEKSAKTASEVPKQAAAKPAETEAGAPKKAAAKPAKAVAKTPKKAAAKPAKTEAQAPQKTAATPANPEPRPTPDQAAKPVAKKPAKAKPKAEPQANPAPQSKAEQQALIDPATSASALRSAEGKAAAELLRRKRARRLGLRFLLFVVLPTTLAAVYYGFIASDQFESYSVFTVHSAENRPSAALESLLGAGPGAASSKDVLAVREYVLSRDMLSKLDSEHDFVDHYQEQQIDWYSRLPWDASFEDAYDYYRDKVYADFDTTAGTLTLRVRAFTPAKAQELTQAILEYSEAQVNALTERERRDRTQYAERQVQRAEKRLADARQDLLKLQQQHAEFNPEQSASAALSVRTELEGELAKARAKVMELRSYLRADAPKVRAAQERVRSLSAQIAATSRRLVDPKREGGLSTSMADFEAAAVEKEFAEKAYASALTALEVARSDAARQHRYVASIARPSAPDESTYPRRILSVLTVFIISFLLLGVGMLLGAAVREHARL